ncbi:MAG: DUF362 domain-containing protein [Armatimonadetes bacterium]|nr:DUF362 domain-containing protein [Armatimonadota bacterium]
MSGIDRRHFLGTVAAAGAGIAAVAGHSRTAVGQTEANRARVVRFRRGDSVDDSDRVNGAVVKEMVDRSVARLTGREDATEAWRSLFGPADVVTVKLNCLFGPGACTHREVTEAVVVGLLAAGVSADKITVWDRATGDLIKCGYELNDGPGVKYTATDWDAANTQSGSFNGPLATVLSNPEVTAVVNVPVLKTHSISGMTLAHKNHYGSFKNPGEHHGNNCDPYLTDLNALPGIKDRTRLIIADALRPVGEGGPSAQPQHTWTYGAVLAAADPVAIDSVGVEILDEWRAGRNMPPIRPKARFLETSAQAGLGVADLSQIELIDL